MANRIYLSDRVPHPTENGHYCVLAQWVRQQYDKQPLFFCISGGATLVIAVYDTTDAEDAAILAQFSTARSVLLSFVRNNTVGDLTVAQRNAINTFLTNKGYDTSWVTLTTPLLQLLRSVVDSIRIAEACSEVTNVVEPFSAFHSKLRTFGNLSVAQKNGVLAALARRGYSGSGTDSETLELICDRIRDRFGSLN